MTTINPTTASSGQTGTGGSILSNVADQKDMFLKLLVAQLKNQDPSSPMDQKDMMAQMAQFTSVEQMTNMVKSMETLTFNSSVSQSVAMIGRSVDYATGTDISSAVESSKVASVNMVNGEIRLSLENGETIKPDAIVRVTS